MSVYPVDYAVLIREPLKHTACGRMANTAEAITLILEIKSRRKY